ncbi:hypothetical protein Tco_1194904 [Tanacetum coccineum]
MKGDSQTPTRYTRGPPKGSYKLPSSLDKAGSFDRVIAAFPDTTFPFLDKPSSTTASLRTNTHVQHSTSSPETFGHISTPEHLKKKKKSVGGGGPSAA